MSISVVDGKSHFPDRTVALQSRAPHDPPSAILRGSLRALVTRIGEGRIVSASDSGQRRFSWSPVERIGRSGNRLIGELALKYQFAPANFAV